MEDSKGIALISSAASKHESTDGWIDAYARSVQSLWNSRLASASVGHAPSFLHLSVDMDDQQVPGGK